MTYSEPTSQTFQPFRIRQYGRQELALSYFPQMTPQSAWRKLRGWMLVNPRLRGMVSGGTAHSRTFTPREVGTIVYELGEP